MISPARGLPCAPPWTITTRGPDSPDDSQSIDPVAAAEDRYGDDPPTLAEWTELHEKAGELPPELKQVFNHIYYHGQTQLEAAKLIGYLPESVPLYPEMRVEEYLTYRAKLKQVDRSTRRSRVEQCLEKCRVKEVRRRLVGTLSKGYRQRVGLADALIADPKVLILDEPTSGLDPIQIRQTLETIKELAGTHTVLLSTHILTEVEAICDRVIIINRGSIRWDGKLSKLGEQVPLLVMRTCRRWLQCAPL